MTRKYPEIFAALLAVLVSAMTILPVVSVPQAGDPTIVLA
jgi:phosphoribosylcarboxyaminoimidazole (NCAIR) mutase